MNRIIFTPVPPGPVNSLVNFEWLRSVLYRTTYQKTLTLVMPLCQEIWNIINLRNAAGRNSNDSISNKNNNSTLNTTNVLL